MPTLPIFFLGLNISFEPTLPPLPTEEDSSSIPFHTKPIFGAKWENLFLTGSIQTKQEHRYLLLGETEYHSQIGVTEIGINLLPTCYKKGDHTLFLNLGAQIDLPSVQITSNAQSEEDTTILQEQYTIDLSAGNIIIGIGVRKEYGAMFMELQALQNLRWNPIFSDEFGTENHFFLQSEGSVTFGWLL
jgi:hypothetical protein